MSCTKCGGSMESRANYNRHSTIHGGTHTAMHGLRGGHPAMAAIGLIGAAAAALIPEKHYYQCKQCGHRIG